MDRNELINEIKKQLKEELGDYRTHLESKIPPEQREQLKKAKDSSTHFIQENPWMSAGIAIIAGFVLSRFLYKKGSE